MEQPFSREDIEALFMYVQALLARGQRVGIDA